jgi:hypothetical protein
MNRMSATDRAAWMNGRTHAAISNEVVTGVYTCDTCEDSARAISHSGNGTPVVVECPKCFLARTERERACRPSRAELIARVNAAVGI